MSWTCHGRVVGVVVGVCSWACVVWTCRGRVADVSWVCRGRVRGRVVGVSPTCGGHVVDALAVASVTSVAVWSSLQYRSCTYRVLSD